MKTISKRLECKQCGKLVDKPGYCQICSSEKSGVSRYEAYLHNSGIQILDPRKYQNDLWK
jgi:hypothetical protein